MSFSPSQINWIMERQFIEAVGFELADTADAYRETGVSPSIGAWGRSVKVSPLEAAMEELDREIPRVVIDPPINLPETVGFDWWGVGWVGLCLTIGFLVMWALAMIS